MLSQPLCIEKSNILWGQKWALTKQITPVIIYSSLWISQLFTSLNKLLLHASAGDKSLHPAPTRPVINHTSIDRSLDWTVRLCSVTPLPWSASRFTWTKNERQMCTMPRTSTSSLRRLFDSLESGCAPSHLPSLTRSFHQMYLDSLLCIKTSLDSQQAECSVCCIWLA